MKNSVVNLLNLSIAVMITQLNHANSSELGEFSNLQRRNASSTKNQTFQDKTIKLQESIDPIVEKYILYCQGQQLNCDLISIEKTLKPLSLNLMNYSDFTQVAYNRFKIPDSFHKDLHQYFRNKGLLELENLKAEVKELVIKLGSQEKLSEVLAPYNGILKITQPRISEFLNDKASYTWNQEIEYVLNKYKEKQKVKLKKDSVINSKISNKPKLIANSQQHNQDETSDDESLGEIEQAASDASSTPPNDNDKNQNLSAPGIKVLSQKEIEAIQNKENEFARSSMRRTLDETVDYFKLFYQHSDILTSADNTKHKEIIFKRIKSSMKNKAEALNKDYAKNYLLIFMYALGQEGTAVKADDYEIKKIVNKLIEKSGDEGKIIAEQFNYIE